MFAAKWFVVPTLCAAIALGSASSALAARKHHSARHGKKPVTMSKTVKASSKSAKKSPAPMSKSVKSPLKSAKKSAVPMNKAVKAPHKSAPIHSAKKHSHHAATSSTVKAMPHAVMF